MIQNVAVPYVCRVDYKAHAAERPYVRQSEAYKRPEGDLDLRTSYTQQYTRTI